MKIKSIKATKINIPMVAPLRWSGGVEKGWTRTIVQVESDDGLIGLGETIGGQNVLHLIHELTPWWIGEDPFDLEKMVRKTLFVPFYYGISGRSAVAALDMACWDLMGKAIGRPVCQLLGGKVRTRIPVIAYLFYRQRGPDGVGGETTPEEMVAHTRDLINNYGSQTIKFKGGVFPPEQEFETLVALREAFPKHRLRFDPNAIWSVETSIRFGMKMLPLDLEYYEDPTWGAEAMARVRKDVPIPSATNMCVIGLDSVPEALRLHSVDVILGDCHEWGGILAVRKLAGLCEALKIGLNLHSGGEFGISTAAYLHIAASLPTLPYAIDSHYHHQTDDIIARPFRYVDGCMDLPEGPGLGVELDHDKFTKYARHNERYGDYAIYERDELQDDWPYKGRW